MARRENVNIAKRHKPGDLVIGYAINIIGLTGVIVSVLDDPLCKRLSFYHVLWSDGRLLTHKPDHFVDHTPDNLWLLANNK